MAFAGIANVSQSSDGTVLTFTDASTGITGFVSRELQILDSNGNVLQDVQMGSALTTTYTISSDAWLRFTETIIDSAGSHIVTVDYLSTAFYEIIFSPLANKLDCCGCDDVCLNLYKAEISKDNAIFLFSRGVGTLAQSNIDAANTFLTEIDCGC